MAEKNHSTITRWTPAFVRFLIHTDIGPQDSCWEWTGTKFTNGYGHLQIRRRAVYAHRFSWKLRNGPIPDGLCICHHCDNPACVNPRHLFLGSHADNVSDKMRKGRHRNGASPGERNGLHKLSVDDVISIRHAYSPSKRNGYALAKQYGVSATNIYFITTGKHWRHLLTKQTDC